MIRTRKRLTAIFLLLLLSGVLALVVARVNDLSLSQALSLRRPGWYMQRPMIFLRYCAVPTGTPESAIVRRFGSPMLTVKIGDPAWPSEVRFWIRAGWSQPPRIASYNVMVYEVVRRNEMIVVYYYIGKDGRLRRTFVSET
jgi:hypothetical protein